MHLIFAFLFIARHKLLGSSERKLGIKPADFCLPISSLGQVREGFNRLIMLTNIKRVVCVLQLNSTLLFLTMQKVQTSGHKT